MIVDPVPLASAFGFLGDLKISASVMQQHQQQQHQQQQHQPEKKGDRSRNGPITRGTWFKSLKKASELSACMRLSAIVQLEDEISILREVLRLHEEKKYVMTSLDAVLEVVNTLQLTTSDIDEDLKKMVIRGQIDLQNNWVIFYIRIETKLLFLLINCVFSYRSKGRYYKKGCFEP